MLGADSSRAWLSKPSLIIRPGAWPRAAREGGGQHSSSIDL